MMNLEELLEQVNARIQVLENDRTERNGAVMTLRISLGQKEEEVKILREQINAHLFENTEGFKELNDLYIVRKHLQR